MKKLNLLSLEGKARSSGANLTRRLANNAVFIISLRLAIKRYFHSNINYSIKSIFCQKQNLPSYKASILTANNTQYYSYFTNHIFFLLKSCGTNVLQTIKPSAVKLILLIICLFFDYRSRPGQHKNNRWIYNKNNFQNNLGLCSFLDTPRTPLMIV